MIEYGKPDNNRLLGDLDKEFNLLEDQYKQFMTSLQNLDIDLNRIYNIQDKDKSSML
jgi:hypothetical protein